MHQHRYIVASDGNLSIRIAPDRLLITPSGLHKGLLRPEQVIMTDLEGRVIRSYHPAGRDLRASSEILMHLEAYRQRPDVSAAIHAHPPMAVACSVVGISLAEPVLPEIVYHLRAIPTIPYATPAGPASADAIRDPIRDHDALLLERHGTLTVGQNLEEAYMRLEQVEHAATVLLAAHRAGRIEALPAEEVSRLLALRRAASGQGA